MKHSSRLYGWVLLSSFFFSMSFRQSYLFSFSHCGISTPMVSQRETDEDTYNTRIEALREEIQSLLDNDKVEEAKVVQEKKALLETLHIPYPTWPFRIRSK